MPQWLETLIWILAVACLVVPLIWWLLNGRSGAPVSPSQHTAGASSANFGGTTHIGVANFAPVGSDPAPGKPAALAADPHIEAKPKQPKPKPNLSMIAINVRLVKVLGPIPSDDPAERSRVIRKINLHIVDTVKHNEIHVWGRIGDTALQSISEGEWERGTVDFVLRRLQVGSGHSGYRYDDLTFNEEEINQRWPEASA